jgi:hypothetical protein
VNFVRGGTVFRQVAGSMAALPELASVKCIFGRYVFYREPDLGARCCQVRGHKTC